MEYYSAKNMVCKGQKGYECNYLSCGAWCKYCGYVDFSDEDLKCLDDFSSSNIKKSKKLHIQLIGPDNTPYNRKFYQLVVTIPNNYPQEPPILRFGTQLYHVNVNHETSRFLYNKITKNNWKSHIRLIQVILETI